MLDEGEWSVSHSSSFNAWERARSIHIISVWEGITGSLDMVIKKEIMTVPGMKSQAACTQSLVQQQLLNYVSYSGHFPSF
jgi:hypothetical protein